MRLRERENLQTMSRMEGLVCALWLTKFYSPYRVSVDSEMGGWLEIGRRRLFGEEVVDVYG